MDITNEQVEQIMDQLPEKVSNEVLIQIIQKLPDSMSKPMMFQIVANALNGVPRNLPNDQIVAMAFNNLKNKSEENKEGPWSSEKITRDYFDSLLLEMRLMDAELPTTDFCIYGESFSSPIMTAALSHLGSSIPNMPNPMIEYAKGASLAGSVHWIGMGSNEELDEVIATGAKTIKIIKPYHDESEIYRQIEHAQNLGALAVGMDIDHIFTRDGRIDVIIGEQMAVKSSVELKKYIDSTSLPFIIKGILSVHDAVKCVEIGAGGIVLSHHGGRLNYAVPPLKVLPDIVRELGTKIPIFVDCGITSGMDAYKALSLGATAVSVGKHLIPYVQKGGAQGVSSRLSAMADELRGVMANTGVKNVCEFDPTVLHLKDF